MSLRHVLLGLLAESSGYGYSLRKQILHRLGHFRNINEGQLYTELARLEKEGLTRRDVVVPEKGPARKIFHITREGRARFREWLLSDALEDEGVLYDFMRGYPFFSKCTFLHHLDTAQTVSKIDRQVDIVRRKRDAYREIRERMKRRGADPIRIRVLDYGLEEMEHRLRWLEDLREVVGRQEGQEGEERWA